jgi:hypothetical protein
MQLLTIFDPILAIPWCFDNLWPYTGYTLVFWQSLTLYWLYPGVVTIFDPILAIPWCFDNLWPYTGYTLVFWQSLTLYWLYPGVLQLYDVQSTYNKNKNINIKLSPHDARFWNNLHQVYSIPKDWKAKLFKCICAWTPMDLNRIANIS